MSTEDVIKEYERRYTAFLQAIAANLETHVKDIVSGLPHIDRVGARAKAPDRFAEKITRKDEQGNPKYQKPFTELQDLIGARVIVFYLNDVDVVTQQIKRYFHHIEQKTMVPDDEWAFGYFGKHFILALPRDVVPKEIDTSQVPGFFELQIKTLFQHAWSETNHDIVYKAKKPLTEDEMRRSAYAAAQAWGADRIIEELRSDLM
jgi:ppGpp synthetase/RelA/SpoT-type nucleotidyltranferase